MNQRYKRAAAWCEAPTRCSPLSACGENSHSLTSRHSLQLLQGTCLLIAAMRLPGIRPSGETAHMFRRTRRIAVMLQQAVMDVVVKTRAITETLDSTPFRFLNADLKGFLRVGERRMERRGSLSGSFAVPQRRSRMSEPGEYVHSLGSPSPGPSSRAVPSSLMKEGALEAIFKASGSLIPE